MAFCGERDACEKEKEAWHNTRSSVMKIRISVSLVLTLGVAYVVLAMGGGGRWKLLPDPQSPIWVGTFMALIVAGLGVLMWRGR